MTKTVLLDALAAFTEDAVKDILLPVRRQKEDTEDPKPRTADVYKMRLTKGSAAQKLAPYIIHQIITGKDTQQAGQRVNGQATVRSIFCVYCEDEQEGALHLLNLMERVRIGLLEAVVVGKQFRLDLEAGVESLIYPDDTAPYYAGEMVTTWAIPAPERKVDYAQ